MSAVAGIEPERLADLSLMVDPKLGIVRSVTEFATGGIVHHAEALTSDPSALGGAPGPFRTSAASTVRERAVGRSVAEAIGRYGAALYERDGLPLATPKDAGFPTVLPASFALYAPAQLDRPGFPYVPFDADTPVRWTGAVDLVGGNNVYLPAAFVWFPYPWLRAGGDLPLAEPTLAGLACRQSVPLATLAGLYDVIATDALAIFWQAAISPPRLRLETLPEELRDLVARLSGDDEIVVLDVTGDNRVPAFAAVSVSRDPGTPALAFGGAAGLSAEAAVRAALLSLAENRRLAGALRQAAPTAVNDFEDVTGWADHLAFAADAANRRSFDFALASDQRHDIADHERRSYADTDAELEAAIGRVLSTSCRVYASNLTGEDIAALSFAVVRVVVPGYHPLFARHQARALGGDRLYDVPRRLGHRGLVRGSSGNPVPHPFARGPIP